MNSVDGSVSRAFGAFEDRLRFHYPLDAALPLRFAGGAPHVSPALRVLEGKPLTAKMLRVPFDIERKSNSGESLSTY
jgi:hypothetical protein